MGKQVVDALSKVAEWYKNITADQDGKPVTGNIMRLVNMYVMWLIYCTWVVTNVWSG